MVTIVVVDGVYKAGFATSQEAYQEAVTGVFDGLDRVEAILKEKPYLCGDDLTEADIRLYVTVVSACSPNVSRQPVASRLALPGTIRSGLCRSFQVQRPNHSS
jgi:glutathione S-transferase